MQNKIYRSTTYDPWYNLALEEYLFNIYEYGCILYLWQNQNTVVIGANQNAWAECRVEILESEGGKLARRSSGGGAVFHDLGNLCFTFIVKKKEYNLMRQLGVILSAVKSLDIDAEFSGRNDLLANGCKFSGNAFKFSKTTGLHHGTLLVNVDMDKLGRYLTPSHDKIQAKGIASVRSRVCNLADLRPGLTVEVLSDALEQAFIAEYGPAQKQPLPEIEYLQETYRKYASWEWRLGNTPVFDIELKNCFGWGEIRLDLSLKEGKIWIAKVYSDAMDEAFISSIAPALIGCPFDSKAMADAILRIPPSGSIGQELAGWLNRKASISPI